MDNLSNLWIGKRYKRKSRTYESANPGFYSWNNAWGSIVKQWAYSI